MASAEGPDHHPPGSRPAHWLVRAAALAAGAAVMLMTMAGTLDVLGLLLLGQPLPGAYELLQTLLVAAVMLPMALAEQQDRHIRVTVLCDRLPPGAAPAFDLLNALLTLAFFGLIAWFGWGMAIKSTLIGEFTSGLILFPVWPAKLALAAGASLMVLQTALDVRAALQGLKARLSAGPE